MPTAPSRRSTRWPRTSSAFLVWTAEPKLENRHRAGLAVLIFLIFATMLGYLAYRNIWAEAKRKVAPDRAARSRQHGAAASDAKDEAAASPAKPDAKSMRKRRRGNRAPASFYASGCRPAAAGSARSR